MKEGGAYDTAEAGPLRPRLNTQRAWSANEVLAPSRSRSPSSTSSALDEGNESENDEHEIEAQSVEDSIPNRPSFQQRQSQVAPRRKPHLPHLSLDLPLHTSASEIFSHPQSDSPMIDGDGIETEGRGGAKMSYSSLPPSPRGEFMGTPKEDIRVSGKDLNNLLGDLEMKQRGVGEEAVNLDTESETEVEGEEFWPARSRRPTLSEEDSYRRSTDDDELTSPTSAAVDTDSTRRGSDVKLGPIQSKTDVLGIWDLLKDEMGAEDWDGWVVDGKWERIANFLAVPLAVEKTTLFGALLCLDGFLYNFTVLPIRSLFALTRIFNSLGMGKGWWPIPLAHINSILRMLLLVIPTVVLLIATDASKMYHTVRGQDTIKLYVIFNALEIADRLCCAFGQDVLDTLFAKETLSPSVRKRGKGRKRQQARPAFFFALSLGYVLCHSLIFFYMLVSLNVAINSYDYTLLSLLISNQFVEIKGSVFKKFEKENLFQIMCADIVERFQLSLMLAVIALRNIIEMSGSEIAFLPKSFMKGKSLVDSILSPILFVIMSEMIVDWLKHAFITKFNHVRASVYERFTDVLAKDVLLAGSVSSSAPLSDKRRQLAGRHRILLDQSPLVARRLGFASIPLACLVIRVAFQAIGMLTTQHGSYADERGELGTGGSWDSVWAGLKVASWVGVGVCAWGCLVFLKIILGLSLLGYSAMRQEGMDDREEEDKVNDFGRSAVGESKEETEYNRQTKEYLTQPADDLPDYPSFATSNSSKGSVPLPRAKQSNDHREKEGFAEEKAKSGGGKKGKKWRLEEVERWTMVKRIW
ncbi:hypothetical protein L202_02972 [Cryptococcus amylolentus CBS 6039]|uniref:DUF747-domain-containing protein n=1 Tax=Cryptococcus amylolentus CBS 6039 TaxID=1295533 RepID=A0A1E3HX17_9TREE|nr:hypothetical protein L202_02972 [Cryptococcus amylolentus CBS 6039]ODN80829.1 hypothetical protein L202_02972 [Cryptococcus amylolentus CBS 6039]